MEKTQKILLAISAAFIIYIFVSLPALIEYFKPKNYFSINGKNYTIADIEKEKPAIISKVKKEYTENLKRVFDQYANEKILELEAKEKSLKPSEVVSAATGSYVPNQSEIAAIYEQFKPQFNGAPLSSVQDKIIGYLKNLKERDAYQEIMKKYEIKFFMEEVKAVRQEVAENGNPSLGPDKAKVTIIEFSDFECTFCQRSQSVNKQLREQYKDKIRWVFRDFPLPFHEDAKFAHIAANCGREQDKYWEYFNTLFENTGNLKKENVLLLAEKSGLDKEKLKKCLANSSKIESEIETDVADGQKVGVNGTPAFFINGIFVEGAQPLASFQKIIDEELNK